jgi:Icc-related predicted phosphoesterase
MAIYVVSDLHGAADSLRKAVPEGATLVLLGDLVNFLDYISMTGILTEVFPLEAVRQVVELRTAGDVLEARRVMKERSLGREDEIRAEIGVRVNQQYAEVFDALPDPTYLILGNVDNPPLAESFAAANEGVHLVDGTVVTLEGQRFGFIGGALPTPLHVAAMLSSLTSPAVPELCFDTLAGKHERGSVDLLRYIEDVQPRRAYFGHVHQPLVSSMHIGRTRCINAGYFRSTARAWRHSPE